MCVYLALWKARTRTGEGRERSNLFWEGCGFSALRNRQAWVCVGVRQGRPSVAGTRSQDQSLGRRETELPPDRDMQGSLKACV